MSTDEQQRPLGGYWIEFKEGNQRKHITTTVYMWWGEKEKN